MQWLLAALILFLGQIVLAVLGVDAQTRAAGGLFMAVQAVTVVAVLAHRRTEPRPFASVWLLLMAAVALQLAWASTNMLAGLVGDASDVIGRVAVVFSGLYMLPCMYIIASAFDRRGPRVVDIVDLAQSALVAGLLCDLIFSLMPGGPHASPTSILVIIQHADAIDFSLAAMATLRIAGTRSLHKRFFYFATATFLWINAMAAWAYNRLELTGLPPWTGPMISLAYVALIYVLARPVPARLSRYRPGRRTVQTVNAFAPVILALGTLLLAVSVSRFDYALGMSGAAASIVLYALRVAFIQSRSQDLQRAAQIRNQSLRQQLGRDPLTGIANRVVLEPRLRETLHEGAFRGAPCSLLMIDIDLFKQFNDSRGHLAGDECLCRVAHVLAAQPLPPDSLVARYGGEEFAVVLPHTDTAAARAIAEHLIESMERLCIPHPHSPTGYLTISIGAASVIASANNDPMALIEGADQALYRAKREGRNRCVWVNIDQDSIEPGERRSSLPANQA